MRNQLTAESIINTLKNAIRWKNNTTIKANKIALNVFIDFVKLRFIQKNDFSTKTFLDFQKNPLDLKAEGKLETWVEIALIENTALLDDLLAKIENVENFYKKNLLGEKSESNVAKSKEEVKSESNDEAEVIEDDDSDDEQIDETAARHRPIIVPWDFSQVAGYALEHAVMFAKTTKEQIFLLHITKSDKEISKAQKDMEKIAKETFAKSKIKPKVMVQTGNIFKTITQIANDNNAKFVIMGTHGIKGMQKFTGSLALKVIAGTNTPFIVVQEPPVNETIRNIVFPIDNRKESKQKLKQANLLARYYKVKYTLTIPEKVTGELANKNFKQNLAFVKSYFKQHSIEFEVHKVSGTDNFSDATLKYAAEYKPDMIIVLTTKNINIQDYVLGADEQKVIANKSKIPVMCINPMKVKYSTMSVHGVT
jgi:nucleotide-binding universal stress UspA family protein